jgi:glucose-1-phosphatase
MIKLFIFDMGGVLARDFDILPQAAALFSLREEEMLNYIRDDIEGLMNGSIPSAEFWKRFTNRSSVVVDGNPFIDLFNPRLDKATIKLILELKESCAVVCGTNTIAEHYNYHKGRGDYAVFDRVYASQLIGIAKPRAEFFQWILDKESVRPEEAVFCDDLDENIQSARTLGINSFLFKDAETFGKEFSESGIEFP